MHTGENFKNIKEDTSFLVVTNESSLKSVKLITYVTVLVTPPVSPQTSHLLNCGSLWSDFLRAAVTGDFWFPCTGDRNERGILRPSVNFLTFKY